MRLYLYAESKNNIGYTPDWLKVTYEENGELLELTLDIQGSIDYQNDKLSCRCKGDLIPWVLWNCETGDEIDLYSITEEALEIAFPSKRIAEIVCNSEEYKVGIYPNDDSDENFRIVEKDKLTNGEGRFEMCIDEDHYYEKDFDFEAELNI